MTKKNPGKFEEKHKKKGASEQPDSSERVSQEETSNAESLNENQDISAENDSNTKDETAVTAEITIQLEKKIEELNQKTNELQDKYIRLSAEFDNYRKRTLREKSDLVRSANENLLKDILPVVDDFERGIDIIDHSQDLDALRTGIHLIYSKFSDFLKQEGLKEINAKEQVFDLEFHEALTKVPAPSEELKGKVVDVIEKGYLLNDKVIRYAKVVVGE